MFCWQQRFNNASFGVGLAAVAAVVVAVVAVSVAAVAVAVTVVIAIVVVVAAVAVFIEWCKCSWPKGSERKNEGGRETGKEKESEKEWNERKRGYSYRLPLTLSPWSAAATGEKKRTTEAPPPGQICSSGGAPIPHSSTSSFVSDSGSLIYRWRTNAQSAQKGRECDMLWRRDNIA